MLPWSGCSTVGSTSRILEGDNREKGEHWNQSDGCGCNPNFRWEQIAPFSRLFPSFNWGAFSSARQNVAAKTKTAAMAAQTQCFLRSIWKKSSAFFAYFLCWCYNLRITFFAWLQVGSENDFSWKSWFNFAEISGDKKCFEIPLKASEAPIILFYVYLMSTMTLDVYLYWCRYNFLLYQKG